MMIKRRNSIVKKASKERNRCVQVGTKSLATNTNITTAAITITLYSVLCKTSTLSS